MKCSEDAIIQKKFVENERTYDFLAGLNIEYVVRVQILGKSEFPSLNEAISIVRAEEGRRGVMLETSSMESSALLALKGLGKERMTLEERKTLDSVRSLDPQWTSAGSFMEIHLKEDSPNATCLQPTTNKVRKKRLLNNMIQWG